MITPSPQLDAAAPHASATRVAPQTGILNRPSEHLIVAAFTIGGEPASTVDQLREIVKNELTSTITAETDPTSAQGETGELGYTPNHDRAHLTITVGFASTAYDKLSIPSDSRPADLIAIPWDKLGDAPQNSDSGDIVLQICSDDPVVAEHALRQVEHNVTGLSTVWAHTGVQRYTTRQGRVASREARGWIGFLDGSSNLDPAHVDGDYQLTFVNPDKVDTYPAIPPSGQPGPYGANNVPTFPPDLREFTGPEPAWTRDGSYLCVRVSATDLPTWDKTSLSEQEATIGRRKKDGVSLDLPDSPGQTDQTPPDFAANTADETVAINAHIRKANPRTTDDLPRRIFRRGYPLYEGSDGTIRRGLVFLSYGRSISTQFEFIFRAWLTNPDFPRPGAGVDRLRAFDATVMAGGYYFVPPLDAAHEPWSWHVPTA